MYKDVWLLFVCLKSNQLGSMDIYIRVHGWRARLVKYRQRLKHKQKKKKEGIKQQTPRYHHYQNQTSRFPGSSPFGLEAHRRRCWRCFWLIHSHLLSLSSLGIRCDPPPIPLYPHPPLTNGPAYARHYTRQAGSFLRLMPSVQYCTFNITPPPFVVARR